MERAFVFVLSYCLALEAYSYQLRNTLCQESLCVYLYDTGLRHVRWNVSGTECTHMGLEMAWIESSQTHLLIERLIRDLSPSKANQFWIGGHRDSDGQWRYMNGTEFSKQTENNADTPSDCMYVTMCKNSEPIFTPDDCRAVINDAGLLCQYDRSETGECQSTHLQIGDKCYMKTKYGGRYPIKIDWYRGQTYCSRIPIKGDIAYSYLDDKDSVNRITRLYSDANARCIRLWLGVRRRIWFWKTGSSSNSNQAINYFNWFTGSMKSSSTGDCISIDANKNNKWLASKCSYYMKYFICMNGTETFKKSTAPSSKEPAVSEATTDSESSGTNYKTAFIVTLVMLSISLIVIMGQVRCYLRSKRRSSPIHRFEKIQVTSNGDSRNTDEVPSTHLPTDNNISQVHDQSCTEAHRLEYEEISNESDNPDISSGYLTMEPPTRPCLYEIPSTYVNITERSSTYTSLGN